MGALQISAGKSEVYATVRCAVKLTAF